LTYSMDCSPLGDRLNFRAFERFPKGKMMPVSARHTENDFFFFLHFNAV
jgi:hypothetical protein